MQEQDGNFVHFTLSCVFSQNSRWYVVLKNISFFLSHKILSLIMFFTHYIDIGFTFVCEIVWYDMSTVYKYYICSHIYIIYDIVFQFNSILNGHIFSLTYIFYQFSYHNIFDIPANIFYISLTSSEHRWR